MSPQPSPSAQHPLLERLERGVERRLGQLAGSPRVAAWIQHADEVGLVLGRLTTQQTPCLLGLGALPQYRDAFQLAAQALPPGQPLFVATLGSGSLPSLHPSLKAWGLESVVPPDLHDLGDALVHAGFEAPVMEAVRLRLRFATIRSALRDLLAAPADFGFSLGEAVPPRGGVVLRALARHLRKEADSVGIELPIELVFGHAWRAKPRAAPSGEPVPVRIYRPGNPSGFSPF